MPHSFLHVHIELEIRRERVISQWSNKISARTPEICVLNDRTMLPLWDVWLCLVLSEVKMTKKFIGKNGRIGFPSRDGKLRFR